MNNIKTINMHKTNMVEHPILFQTPMVRAIMDESKTQTRRDKGLKAINENPNKWIFNRIEEGKAVFDNRDVHGDEVRIKLPYGKTDECMWVREAFRGPFTNTGTGNKDYVYRASSTDSKETVIGFSGWKPSIHMPRKAARNFLIVKSVKIERLNDISEEDCIAEGVRFDKDSGYYFVGDEIMGSDPKWVFLQLWESIHGHNSWDKNPWLWVYEFKLITNWSNA